MAQDRGQAERAQAAQSPGERPRLDAQAAAAFVKKLGERLDYNINIMDRDGMIIASRDPARIGTYHAAARHLLESGGSEERVSPGELLPEGSKPGVNLPLEVRGEVLGAVGVTGDPAAVGDLAQAVKTSVESMIELQSMREAVISRRSRKSLLMAYLLYEESVPESTVLALAGKLGYDPAVPRAAILLRLPPGRGPDEALAAAKAKGAHDSQDIASPVPDGSLLVFRRLGFGAGDKRAANLGVMAAYRDEIRRYRDAFGRATGAVGLAAYAGAPQTDFSRYRGSYRQASWLAYDAEHASRDPGTPPAGRGSLDPVTIFDRLDAYFLDQAPRTVLDDALSFVSSMVPGEARRSAAPTLSALESTGFNVKEAAARLGIHRNTLSARLERLSAFLGVDVRGDPGAMSLARSVAWYIATTSRQTVQGAQFPR